MSSPKASDSPHNGQWVLFAGPGGGTWLEPAGRMNSASALGLQCYQFGPKGELRDIENRWSSAYGVTEDGAVLIRPDG
ncbi:hypothetical protein [Paenibacillus sp. GP183]|uniref:hypothetical protein n=1 Tax=Paenibacillus sp. GP183 TaxID=1882751 RepID=UPI0011153C80|nr:hypothetical protein [Paenibacillus sp. GP183]